MSKIFSSPLRLTVKSGQTEMRTIAGDKLKIRGCSVPFPFVTVAFDDASDENPFAPGDTFNLHEVGEKFSKLIFRNSHPFLDAYIVAQTGNIAITFNPPDNRPASTYLKGNLGYVIPGDISAFADFRLTFSALNNRGLGYQVGDILTENGGGVIPGGASRTIIKVTGVDPRGLLKGYSVQEKGDYTVAPANPTAFSGGRGAGVTFNTTYSNVCPLGFDGSGNFLVLQNGAQWFVDNIDGNSRRKQIVFTVTAGTLIVQDLQSGTCLRVTSGTSPQTLETDGQLWLEASGGSVTFAIAETYFAQS